MNIEQTLKERAKEAETTVVSYLPEVTGYPKTVLEAMEYSVEAGGKRIRPVLMREVYHMCGGSEDSLIAPFMAAIEMIHTYSLVHDDLPAMDDDALRRGKPTNHRVFGEAVAILAGDGLLNLAYETMLSAPIAAERPEQALRAAGEIARRAGVCGMIAGQTADVTLEGHAPTAESVRYIHLHKTADLLTAPVVAGLMLAGATEAQLEAGRTYGRGIGLAFQIVDDLLDLEGDVSLLGKETGMDAQRGKQTWPAAFGVERSRQDAGKAIEQAVQALSPFGERGAYLRELARKTLVRKA